MNNKYIIDKISSYNNHFDLENKFPSFIDSKIDISKNKFKDLKKLKIEVISEKKKHNDKCTNKTNCETSIMYDKSIEIIEIRIQKYKNNKLLKFLSKFWWALIIPILLFVIENFIFK